MKKILFILKERFDYGSDITTGQVNFATGLLNSTQYVVDMLNKNGIEVKLVMVKDNNNIDKEVTDYQPTDVIIEALWVVPVKFKQLSTLHPSVKWYIHLHSDLPFLANEGVAMEWIAAYIENPSVMVIVNSKRLFRELKFILRHKQDVNDDAVDDNLVYLPNFYPTTTVPKKDYSFKSEELNIACFGAIRPMKNQLTQAVAAVMFAEKVNKKVVFHINAARVEQRGESVLRNIQNFFESVKDKGHRLVEHSWYSREEFVALCFTMDLGMQCSFSETFNIVCADLVTQGVPTIGTSEIQWLSNSYTADPNDTMDITEILNKAFKTPKRNVDANFKGLVKFSDKAENIWVEYFKK
jgi:hypothetical protein